MATVNLNVKTQHAAYHAGRQSVIESLLQVLESRASSIDMLDAFEDMLNAEQRARLDAAYSNR